jgi:protein SCO1/2
MNLLLTKFRLSHSGYSSNFTFFALSAITAFAMGIILYYLATTEQRQANLSNLKHATSLYASPRAFPDFILTNHHGQEFTHKNLKDAWNFIFFGFTHCPDICPLTLSTIDQVVNNLANKNKFAVQTVFISVDPKRDSQKQLRDYVQHFNQDMIGLTGGNQELKNLTQALGVVYTTPFNNKDKNYSIDHSAHIFLVAPNGNLVALFGTPHKSQTIVKDFKILNAYYNTQVRS